MDWFYLLQLILFCFFVAKFLEENTDWSIQASFRFRVLLSSLFISLFILVLHIIFPCSGKCRNNLNNRKSSSQLMYFHMLAIVNQIYPQVGSIASLLSIGLGKGTVAISFSGVHLIQKIASNIT